VYLLVMCKVFAPHKFYMKHETRNNLIRRRRRIVEYKMYSNLAGAYDVREQNMILRISRTSRDVYIRFSTFYFSVWSSLTAISVRLRQTKMFTLGRVCWTVT